MLLANLFALALHLANLTQQGCVDTVTPEAG